MGRHLAPEQTEEIPEVHWLVRLLGISAVIFFGALGFFLITLYIIRGVG